jgi:hypothetical protein
MGGGGAARTYCCIWCSLNHVRACRYAAAYSGCHSATCSTAPAPAPAPTVASASFSRIRPSRLSRRFSLLRSSSPAIPTFPYVPRSCGPLPSTTRHIVRRKGEWRRGGHWRRGLRCPCHAAGTPIIQVIAARYQCATGHVTDFPRIDHSVHSVSAMQVNTANSDQTLRLTPFARFCRLTVLQMPTAIVSSKGGGRVVRAAAPSPTAASFSGGIESASKGSFSFGSGGGGGGGSSDVSRYRLHVEPASSATAAAANLTNVAGLHISSSNPGKSADPLVTGGSSIWTNRLKPSPPHAWMDTGHNEIA